MIVLIRKIKLHFLFLKTSMIIHMMKLIPDKKKLRTSVVIPSSCTSGTIYTKVRMAKSNTNNRILYVQSFFLIMREMMFKVYTKLSIFFVIIVPLNGFILHRDYKRWSEVFCANSDGIYLERKINRLSIPWNQVNSCYYRISTEIIGGCFWRLRGVFRVYINLVVERKTGIEDMKLNAFCCNPITIARCIDGCSGKRMFDWKRTKRRFLKDFILWILLPLLFWAFCFFYKQ